MHVVEREPSCDLYRVSFEASKAPRYGLKKKERARGGIREVMKRVLAVMIVSVACGALGEPSETIEQCFN